MAYRARSLGDFGAAFTFAQRAMTVYQTLGPAGENEGWLTLANAHKALNQHLEAGQAFDRAEALQQGPHVGNLAEQAAQEYAAAAKLG
jgi:hypothetical protein